MKALRTFRKVVALTTGALMVGATLFGASAYTLADYPAMFIATPQLTKVVIGDKAAVGDVLGGIDVASSLTQEAAQSAIAAGSGSGSSGVTVVGESASLSSGTDRIYLGQTLRANVQTLTNAELPTILADGRFEDDAGDQTDYEQTVRIGESGRALPVLTFAKPSVSSQKNSLVHLDGDDSAKTNPVLTFETVFDSAIDFTDATNSKGQELNLFGKSYKVGTSTASELVLYLSSNSITLKPGQGEDVTIDGNTYSVTVLGVNTAGDKVTVEVCNAACDVEEISESTTKRVLDLDVFADLVSAFNTESDPGFAVLGLSLTGQANSPLYLSSGNSVRVGSNKDDIEGSEVTIGGTVAAMTSLTVETTWNDDDVAWAVPGDSFLDPVFGVLKLDFLKLNNGPQFRFASVHDDRPNDVEVSINDDTHLIVNWENDNEEYGQSMIYLSGTGADATLADDDNLPIHVVEGASIADEETTIIRSGQRTFFFQVKKINTGAAGSGDLEIKDLLTGELYKKNDIAARFNTIADSVSFNAGGQTFFAQLSVVTADAEEVRLFAGTAATKQATDGTWDSGASIRVYSPFTPFGTSYDHQVFFAEDVMVADEFNANTGNTTSLTIVLPTGTVTFAATSVLDTTTVTIDGVATTLTKGTPQSLRVGRVVYTFSTMAATSGGTGLLALKIALDNDQATAASVAETDAAVVVVGEQDKTNSDEKEAMMVVFAEDASVVKVEASAIISTSAGVKTGTFDDSDYAGTLDPFGLLGLLDSTDSEQTVATIDMSKEQMAADFAVSAAASTIAGGAAAVSGDLVPVAIGAAVLAGNLANYQDWNVVSVGGPCANSVSADLLGNPSDCAEGFTAGKARVLLFNHDNGNAAVLAAGYTEEDSQRATKVLSNWRDYRSDFKGMELEVSGTSMSNLQVTSVLA